MTPDRLDLTRSASGHVTSGHGIHQCIGQSLALLELRLGFTALLDRFPTLRPGSRPGRWRCARTGRSTDSTASP